MFLVGLVYFFRVFLSVDGTWKQNITLGMCGVTGQLGVSKGEAWGCPSPTLNICRVGLE